MGSARTTIAVLVALALLAVGVWMASSNRRAPEPPIVPPAPVAPPRPVADDAVGQVREFPPTSGAVAVLVSDENGKPVPGAVVTLSRSDEFGTGSAPVTATTDDAGTARFPAVAAGIVRVKAVATGVSSDERQVTVLANNGAEVSLRLTPLPPIAAKLAGKRVTIELQQTTGDVVVNYLGQALAVSIVIDPSASKRMQETAVSLSLQNVTMGDALAKLCNAVGGVVYVIDENAGVVTIKAVK